MRNLLPYFKFMVLFCVCTQVTNGVFETLDVVWKGDTEEVTLNNCRILKGVFLAKTKPGVFKNVRCPVASPDPKNWQFSSQSKDDKIVWSLKTPKKTIAKASFDSIYKETFQNIDSLLALSEYFLDRMPAYMEISSADLELGRFMTPDGQDYWHQELSLYSLEMDEEAQFFIPTMLGTATRNEDGEYELNLEGVPKSAVYAHFSHGLGKLVSKKKLHARISRVKEKVDSLLTKIESDELGSFNSVWFVWRVGAWSDSDGESPIPFDFALGTPRPFSDFSGRFALWPTISTSVGSNKQRVSVYQPFQAQYTLDVNLLGLDLGIGLSADRWTIEVSGIKSSGRRTVLDPQDSYGLGAHFDISYFTPYVLVNASYGTRVFSSSEKFKTMYSRAEFNIWLSYAEMFTGQQDTNFMITMTYEMLDAKLTKIKYSKILVDLPVLNIKNNVFKFGVAIVW